MMEAASQQFSITAGFLPIATDPAQQNSRQKVFNRGALRLFREA